MGTKNELLGHAADNDGIEEYDNPLPDWWLGMFGLTIVFAVIYPIYHHGFGNTQTESYDREMAAAELRWPKADMATEIPSDPETIAAGSEIFTQTCASCHKLDLSKGIGPNLFDDEWIHGSEITQILTVITDGVTSKGMPAWGGVLGPLKVQQVAAFILSKKGSVAPSPPLPTPVAVAASGEIDAEALWMEKCAACHKSDMTGLVGPNLLDAEWIHGGELEQIQRTITEGVPAKGMFAWGPLLDEAQIEALARFVQESNAAAQAP